jgi:hypothetical protein
MYGLGENSWCPSCHQTGEVYCCVGHLPDPQLYGQWFMSQQDQKSSPPTDPNSVSSLPNGGSTMKTKQLHSGPYCCPKCYIDYNLVAEEVLKCDCCSGPLVSGTIDDYYTDEGDDQEAVG